LKRSTSAETRQSRHNQAKRESALEAPIFPFDVILFDVGGVLLTNGWDQRERAAVIEHFQLDLADFEALHIDYYDAWERASISLTEYLDATVFYEPRSFSRDEFFAFMLTQSKPQPDGALGILSELAASNQCLLGALNNEARETNEYRFDQFGLRKFFKVSAEFLLSWIAQAGAGDLPAGAGYSGQAGGADSLYRRPRGECGRGCGCEDQSYPV
jgi:hypothetical protein